MTDAIDLQAIGAELRIYGEIDHPEMREMNPAICWDGDKLKIAIRRCNFSVNRHGNWYFRDNTVYSRTDVMYGDLNPDTLEVSNLTKLKLDENSPKNVLLAGLEDVRLFNRKDGMHAIGFESDRLNRRLHNASAGMAEYIIKGNTLKYLKSLQKPLEHVVEKNWCPPDKPSKLFDYTYSDSQSYKDGKLIGRPTRTEIHGGSILLSQTDGTYLSLVHEKKLDTNLPRQPRRIRQRTFIYDKYTYYTYLARHDERGIIIELSKPFRFGTLENIEFASGLAEYEDCFIMTTGIRDCKVGIAKIEKSKLISLMEVV